MAGRSDRPSRAARAIERLEAWKYAAWKSILLKDEIAFEEKR